MEKETKLESGAFLRELRENKKVSRNDLKHICHANTLRNFEVGFNQINIEDFLRIYLSLGYLKFNILDVLRLSKDPAHSKFFNLNDKFENIVTELFNRYGLKDLKEVDYEDEDLPLTDRLDFLVKEHESFASSHSFEMLENPLKQMIYSNKSLMKSFLGTFDEKDFSETRDAFYLSYSKGQSNFTSVEIKLLLSIIIMGTTFGREQLRIGETAFIFLCSKSILEIFEEQLTFEYLLYVSVNDQKKYTQLKRRYFDSSTPIRKIFNYIDKK